ncbi:MAG: hypothetical protein JSS83_20680 [Cyanobacteria bacterium SZAS LIN-3]|nr:hypothetical protein [Cyanobacteria bacterium SZAS LIN-3]
MSEEARPLSVNKELVASALAVALPPIAYLLYDLINCKNDISSWLAMRIVGAQLLLREQKLYVDFWDWTQPIVFECLRLPLLISQGLEKLGVFLSADLAVHLAVWLLLLLSCAATAAVALQGLRRLPEGSAELSGELRDNALALIFATALTALIVRFDFGDLPQLLVLALAPWSLMRWLAYRDIVLSPRLTVPLGLAAGLAACCDLPFIAFFLAVELVLALEKGSIKQLWCPDWLALLLVLGLDFVSLLRLEEPVHTAFWKWTMPLKLANYQIYDGSLYGTDSCPDRRDVLYSLALSLGLAFLAGRKSSFLLPVVTISLSGFGLYILEKQGLSRDLIPTIFGSLFCLLIFVGYTLKKFGPLLLPQRELKALAPFALVSMLLLSGALTTIVANSLNADRNRMHTYVSHRSEQGYKDLLTVFNDRQVWKDPVWVISDYPAAAYPALLSLGAQPTGYMLWARPLRVLDWLKHHQLMSAELKDFSAYISQKLSADLRSRGAGTIIVESFEKDVLDHAGLWTVLTGNYVSGQQCRYYSNNSQPREFVGHWEFEEYTRKP